MPASSAVHPTTTPTVRHLTIRIGNKDVTPYVLMDSFELEDTAGDGAQGTFRCTLNRALSLLPDLTPNAWTRIFDHDTGIDIFRGFLKSYKPVLDQGTTYRMTDIVATDHGELMDRFLPSTIKRPAESDRTRIGYFWGKYHNARLNPHLTYVQQIDASIPAVIYNGVTLRRVMDDIAAAAGTTPRWNVDQVGRLHYYVTESNPAPKNVTSDAPGAGEISVEDLEIQYDAGEYANAVWVQGGNALGTGWVYDLAARARIGTSIDHTEPLDAPHVKTAALRDKVGAAFLARITSGVTRGSFSTTSNKATGWLSGQTLTVRSSSVGITADTRIVKVRTTVLKNDVRHYDIEFGALRHIKAYRNLRPGSGTRGLPAPAAQWLNGALSDDSGGAVFSTHSDADGSAGLGSAPQGFVQKGIYNSAFALAPLSADASLTDHNTLPNWSSALPSGTGIDITSIVDTTTSSGRVIQFVMSSGAAGDEGYIEQITPVNGSANRAFGFVPVGYFESSATWSAANTEVFTRAQYLTQAGATTGSEIEFARTMNASEAFEVSAAGSTSVGLVAPANASFIRVRFGMRRKAAGAITAVSVGYLTDTYLTPAQPRLSVTDVTLPDTWGIGNVSQGAGKMVIAPAIGSAVTDVAPAIGMYRRMYFEYRSQSAIAAGDTILPSKGYVLLSAVAPRTMTATPTVQTTDVDNGSVLILQVAPTSSAITLQDRGTLANSALYLSTATVVLSGNDSITLLYSATQLGWTEIARTNVL